MHRIERFLETWMSQGALSALAIFVLGISVLWLWSSLRR